MTNRDERRDAASLGETRLDAWLRDLPQGVEPSRDLWPAIEARLEPRARRWAPSWAWQAAAAVLLVAGSSLLTATLLDDDGTSGKMAATPGATVAAPADVSAAAVPANYAAGSQLDPEYLAARRQLTAMLNERIANLPDSTRAKLEQNLAEMRRAAEQINAALAEQPGDPLLQDLLLKTYQDELAVLANVNQLTNALGSSASDATKAESKRIDL
ncbi:MAG TPA: hypothetical protein VNS57_17775 [Steroidobacteraceae bacterium]|nr:hypothetical protein [Steroidobacteraceae bacterium]